MGASSKDPEFCLGTMLATASLLHAIPQYGRSVDIRAHQRSKDEAFVDMLEHMTGVPSAREQLQLLQALHACVTRAVNSFRKVASAAMLATRGRLRAPRISKGPCRLSCSSSSSSAGSGTASSSKHPPGATKDLQATQLLSEQLKRMPVLAQQLLAARLLDVSVPAARAAVSDHTFSWGPGARLVDCIGSLQLRAAAVTEAGSLPAPQHVALVYDVVSYSQHAADKQATLQLTAESCGQMLQQIQQAQNAQQGPQGAPGPSSGLQKLAADAARCRNHDLGLQAAERVKEAMSEYEKQYPADTPEAWQRLLGHTLVVQHHTEFGPGYRLPSACCGDSSHGSSSSSGGNVCASKGDGLVGGNGSGSRGGSGSDSSHGCSSSGGDVSRGSSLAGCIGTNSRGGSGSDSSHGCSKGCSTGSSGSDSCCDRSKGSSDVSSDSCSKGGCEGCRTSSSDGRSTGSPNSSDCDGTGNNSSTCKDSKTCNSSRDGSSLDSRPCGMLCPMVSCGWCKAPLNNSHSIMLHLCSNKKLLQYAELLDLAHTAGCEALPGGCCFLCKSSAEEGQPHLCSSILWHLFAIDHSQLPHANPAEDPRVLFQTELVNIRRHCHIIVHTIFVCPEEYLPASLLAASAAAVDCISTGPAALASSAASRDEVRGCTRDAAALRLLREGMWPLLRSLIVIGPSSMVPRERGGYALLPPDHWQDELCLQDDGTYRLGAGLQEALEQQHRQRSSSSSDGTSSDPGSSSSSSSRRFTGMFVPCVTRSMAGFYTGALRLDLPTDDDGDDDLAVTCLQWDGQVHCLVDPRKVGSMHVLFNQAHNWASVLEPRHVTFPRADGTRTQPQLLMQVVQRNSPAKAAEQRKRQARQQQQGWGLVELTWDYAASTNNPQDKLLRIKCLCESCINIAKAKKGPAKRLGKLRRNPMAKKQRKQ